MANSRSILIVDDHPENLKVLSRILEKEDFRIRIAKNGLEAIESVEAEAPSVILMDIQMPGIDGYETTRRLKSVDKYESIPVLFISALTEAFDKIKAFRAGGQDFITKPFQEEEVVARVRTHFRMYEYQQQLENLNIDLFYQLDSSFDQAAVGIIHIDSDTKKLLKVNRYLCNFLGYSQAELFTKTISDVTHPDSVNTDLRDLISLKTGKSSSYTKEKQYIHKDGNSIWARITVSHVKPDREGVPNYYLAFFEDITKNKNIERKLNATQLQYTEFINQSSDVVTLWKMPPGLKTDLPIEEQIAMFQESVCVDANRAAWTASGYNSKDQLVGKKYGEVFTSGGSVDESHRIFIKQNYRIDNQLVHVVFKNGEEYFGLGNRYGIVKDGELINLWTASKNITEQKKAENAILESEERLKLATSGGNIGIWDWDVKNDILVWDDSMYTLYDVEKGEFSGAYDAFATRVHPDDLEATESEIEKALKGEKNFDTEFRIFLKNGNIKHLRASGIRYLDELGDTTRFVGINYDITEIKRAEIRMQKSESRLIEAQTLANLGNWELNLKSNELYWSDQIYNIFEKDRSEFEASYEAFVETIHPDDRDDVDRAYKNHLVAKEPYNIEHRLMMPDGRIKYVQEQCNSFFNEEGEPIVSIGTVQDITAKKETELELLNQYNRIQLIMDTMQDGYIYADQDGFIRDVNPAYCEIIGYSRKQLLTMNIRNIEAKTPSEEMEHRIQQIINKGSDHFETKHKRKDGKIIDIETNITVVLVDEQPMVAAFVRDISTRKQTEKEILELNMELEARVNIRTKELEQEKVFTESILDAIPGVFFTIDEGGKFVNWNKNLLKISGYSKKEIAAISASGITVPEDVEKLNNTVGTIFQKGSGELELNIISKDGEKHPFFTTGRRFRRDSKNYIIGTGFDLSEQRKAEAEVRKLSEAVIHSPATIVITDPDGRIEYVNPKFSQVSGYSSDEAIGKNPRILKSGVHSDEYFKKMWDTINAGKIWNGEFCNKKKNGEVYWEKSSISSIKDEHGNILHFIAVKENITQRKNNEAKIKYRLDIEKLLAELSTKMINLNVEDIDNEINKALKRICTFFNTGLAYIFKFSDDHQNHSMTHLSATSKFKARIKEKQNLKTDSQCWWINQLLAGKIVNVPSVEDLDDKAKLSKELFLAQGIHSVIDLPMIYEDKVIGFIGVASEISNRKWSVDELFLLKLAGQIFTNALHRKIAVEELQIARSEAENATLAKSQFLASMSHEIRTPMNAVIGLSYLAMQTELNPKQHDYLYKIQSSGKTLLGVINDILDFSKIEAGKLTIENTNFDLEKVFNELATVITYKAHEKDIEVVFNIQDDVPHSLIGDPLRISQILINLCNNAVKFTQEGEILVQVELEKETKDDVWLKFLVRDTGIGIKEDQISKLFESFSQADKSTTREFGGSGLGLSICKNLVELMDGDIHVESKYGKGSTFSVNLKFKKQQDQKLKQLSLANDLKEMKVLVCDDNLTSLEVLSSMLRAFSFKVKAVKSGKDALLEMEKEIDDPYRLIIMDWKMPGMDGIQVVEKIKANKRLSSTPAIIMVTAYTRDQVILKAEELQLAGLLSKPVSHSTMLDTIMQAFGKEAVRISIDQVIESKYQDKLNKRKGARILLVEDHEINQQVATELIESGGFIVEISNNGLEAINRLNESADFDLVFMDLQMPVMDGITASEKLRKNKSFDHIPIVAMTADVVGEIKEKCLKIGMNDFVPKPISPETVFDAIIKWIKPGKRKLSDQKKKVPDSGAQKIEIPDIEGINIREGLNRVNNNTELYQKLLLKFYDNNVNLVERLKNSFKCGNEDAAVRMVHTVKGVSGNIGANDLHIASKELEKRLKKKDYDDLDSILDKYNLTLSVVINSIGEYKKSKVSAEEKTSDEKDGKPLDKNRFGSLLSDLKALLEENDMDAGTKLEDILVMQGLGDLRKQLDLINKALKSYDFDQALLELKNIKQ